MTSFGQATLNAPLTHSLELSKGTGDPTFTRATYATVFDDQGKLLYVPSGVARFGGARLVRNLVETDFTSWIASNTTQTPGQLDPEGGSTAYLSTVGTSAVNYVRRQNIPLDINDGKVSAGFYFKKGTGVWYRLNMLDDLSGQFRVWFNAQTATTGTESAIGGASIISSQITAHPSADGWYLFQLTGLANPGSSTLLAQILAQDGDGSTTYTGVAGSTITLWHPQVEPVTGRSDVTLSEFVSVGELSAPYHGAGADGAKWFNTHKDGTSIANNTLLGYLNENATTNNLLYSRDLTNAAWTKTNVTAALDQTGLDNAPNTATKLTSTAANGTVLQGITMAAAARTFSAYVKRITGTGTIEITRDNGTTWVDITDKLNTSTYCRVSIDGTSVTNPTLGFRIVTSGDVIGVDACQDEAGIIPSSPMITLGSTQTRNADSLSYQTSGNFSDTEGAISAKIRAYNWDTASGGIGSSTTGLHLINSNSRVQALDGTNTVNGPSSEPLGHERLAIAWAGSVLRAAAEGSLGTAGSYDGAFGLSSIAVDPNGYTKNLFIWTTELSDDDLKLVTNVDFINGLPRQFNDAFVAFARQELGITHGTFNDLWIKYFRSVGVM